MNDNVSKSVARTFAVFELLRERRQPLTAAAMRRELDVPQPSLRALLAKLVELDYLSFDPGPRTYFPTARLAALGQAGGGLVRPDSRWRAGLDRIAAQTGETTSLCIASGLYLEVLYARMADHPVALRLRPGRGDLLWRSAAGRLLLGAGSGPQRRADLEAMAHGASGPGQRREILALAGELDAMHKRSWYTAYDLHLKGVGAVCCRVHYAQRPAVIAVAGVNDRIRDNERAIRRSIRACLPELAVEGE